MQPPTLHKLLFTVNADAERVQMRTARQTQWYATDSRPADRGARGSIDEAAIGFAAVVVSHHPANGAVLAPMREACRL